MAVCRLSDTPTLPPWVGFYGPFWELPEGTVFIILLYIYYFQYVSGRGYSYVGEPIELHDKIDLRRVLGWVR